MVHQKTLRNIYETYQAQIDDFLRNIEPADKLCFLKKKRVIYQYIIDIRSSQIPADVKRMLLHL